MKPMYPCWFWEDAIPHHTLDTLAIETAALELLPGEVGNGVIDKTIRDSNSNALPAIHWFTGALFNYAVHANQSAEWGRTIEFTEVTQIAEYGVNQHYDWHNDTRDFFVMPYDRKITVICLLNDPSEFEGGDFEIERATVPKLKRGSVIAFPSNLRHRVTPVTKGKRLSATCWAVGPQKW